MVPGVGRPLTSFNLPKAGHTESRAAPPGFSISPIQPPPLFHSIPGGIAEPKVGP